MSTVVKHYTHRWRSRTRSLTSRQYRVYHFLLEEMACRDDWIVPTPEMAKACGVSPCVFRREIDALAKERLLIVFGDHVTSDLLYERTSLRESIPASVRRHVFERDDFKCVYCGSPDHLEIDHIVPVSKGGTNDIENLSTACLPCNRSKGSLLLQDWMEKL